MGRQIKAARCDTGDKLAYTEKRGKKQKKPLKQKDMLLKN